MLSSVFAAVQPVLVPLPLSMGLEALVLLQEVASPLSSFLCRGLFRNSAILIRLVIHLRARAR